MHTVSVGFARASDLDEVVDAARMFADNTGKTDALLKAAESKLQEIAVDKLGKDWYEKGLLNVPSFYTEASDGIALGHMLWLHNCLTAYGMYEFAKDRYGMLEGASAKWKKNKSFEENKKKCL
jgi:predicted aldo/keto reductase-like oxidoreductase